MAIELNALSIVFICIGVVAVCILVGWWVWIDYKKSKNKKGGSDVIARWAAVGLLIIIPMWMLYWLGVIEPQYKKHLIIATVSIYIALGLVYWQFYSHKKPKKIQEIMHDYALPAAQDVFPGCEPYVQDGTVLPVKFMQRNKVRGVEDDDEELTDSFLIHMHQPNVRVFDALLVLDAYTGALLSAVESPLGSLQYKILSRDPNETSQAQANVRRFEMAMKDRGGDDDAVNA